MRSERRALDKLYKRRDRYEIPDWQREEVWGTDRQQLLVDSILRGWKLPKFYFLKTSEDPDEFDVVDGQQRLKAIWAFFDGDIALSEVSAAEFGGSRYEDLPEARSDAFDDYEIECDEITEASDADVKEFFQRLQAGLPLSSSEKLNSVHSRLRDYCTKVAKHAFFSETTAVSSRRYAYFDVVSKVVTLELEGLEAGLRYEDVRQVFLDNASFSGNSAVAKRIGNALDVLHASFPGRYPNFRNRTIVQSVITLVCHLLQAGMDSGQHDRLKTFVYEFLGDLSRQVELGQQATDIDYLTFQRTVNANVRSGAKTRQAVLLRKLFRQHPDFYSSLSASSTLAAGLKEDIDRLAASVRQLVTTCNERYAARNDEDLFKLTNKAVAALGALDSAVHSVDEYKRLIDDLYFVFREGPGQRLADQWPPSFVDVNDLRTMVRHDVDHGGAARAGSKRKALAAVFAKYAGVNSPEAVDPSQFPLVHANVLGALEADLQVLAKSLV
jgi:hypothetical protein